MDFSKVDRSFRDWAKTLELSIQTSYKGSEVRSTSILDSADHKWQLWLVPVNEDDQCVIHYWDYKNISKHEKVDNYELLSKLTEISENIISNKIPESYLP